MAAGAQEAAAATSPASAAHFTKSHAPAASAPVLRRASSREAWRAKM